MLRARYLLLTLATLSLAAVAGGAGKTLRVNGSTTINPVVVEAADALRAEKGLQVVVDTQGGSSGGIAALGDGRAEIAMISRPLEDEDRARYPKVRFQATRLGTDGVALVVHGDVWKAGVKALSKEQARAIYEGRLTNWKQAGGRSSPAGFTAMRRRRPWSTSPRSAPTKRGATRWRRRRAG
jgi:phosphate transport system substrate-binding protein